MTLPDPDGGGPLARPVYATPNIPRVILTSAYDAASNRTSLAASVGGTSDFLNTYSFDTLGRMSRVDQTANGGSAVAEKRIDFGYNGASEFTSITRYKDTDGGTANEVAKGTYTIDSVGRLTGLAYTKNGANIFTPYSWGYDDLSRVTTMTSADGTVTYSYDSNSQLTGADYSFQSDGAYSYDANGNRTMSGYTTGTNNRLTSDGTYNYLYDNEGNRTRRTKISTGEYEEYTWDHRNRLTRVEFKTSAGATTKSVAYVYDVYDRKLARSIDTTSPFDFADAPDVFSVWDGEHTVLHFSDPDGNGAQPVALKGRDLYAEATDMILAEEDAVTLMITWPLQDELGTVRHTVNSSGAITGHLTYNAFGGVTSGNAALVRHHFTGKELDPDTGLQYNWMRWYDPRVGRWISEDPIGFAAGDSNVSRYVRNIPTMLNDPNGLDDIDLSKDPRSLYVGGATTTGYTPATTGDARGFGLDFDAMPQGPSYLHAQVPYMPPFRDIDPVFNAFEAGMTAGAMEIAEAASTPYVWATGDEIEALQAEKDKAWEESGIAGTWTQDVTSGAANVGVAALYTIPVALAGPAIVGSEITLAIPIGGGGGAMLAGAGGPAVGAAAGTVVSVTITGKHIAIAAIIIVGVINELAPDTGTSGGGGVGSGPQPTDTASQIIQKYKKGSINREFPSELYNTTLKEIEVLKKAGNEAAKKALKLLKDKRFDKVTSK